MPAPTDPMYMDPGYLWGKIEAVQSALFVLMRQTMRPEEALEACSQAIESLRTAAISRPVPETFLRALDEFDELAEKKLAVGPLR